MTPKELFTLFVAAINRHDAPSLAARMAPDHLFVDSLGHRVEGAAPMEAGWRGYFALCPDYWIQTEHIVAERSTTSSGGRPPHGRP